MVAGVAALGLAVLLPVFGSPAADAATVAGPVAAGTAAANGRALPTTVGAMRFSWLPAGLGQPSSFDYSYGSVDFSSTVWESETADGWQVDLHLTVLSGGALSGGQALYDWFTDYQQRPPEEVDYRPVTVRGQPGWLTGDQLFYLVRPGLAVSITVDPSRWSTADLWGIARHGHPART